MESIDASPYSIKLLVNHKLPRGDVTAGYVQLDVERLRPVQQAVTDKMLSLCAVPPKAQVVSIRRKRA